jgi:hypothetical protein
MPADDALSEKAAGILSQFPGPVTLYPYKPKWSAYFVAMSLIAAMAAWWLLDATNRMDGWDIAQAILLLLIVGALALMSAAAILTRYMTFTLDAEGLETLYWFRRRRCSWKNVDGFKTRSIDARGLTLNVVVFNDATRPTGFWYSIGGMNMRLPDTYRRRTAEDFVRLLTAWRERALASSARPR